MSTYLAVLFPDPIVQFHETCRSGTRQAIFPDGQRNLVVVILFGPRVSLVALEEVSLFTIQPLSQSPKINIIWCWKLRYLSHLQKCSVWEIVIILDPLR